MRLVIDARGVFPAGRVVRPEVHIGMVQGMRRVYTQSGDVWHAGSPFTENDVRLRVLRARTPAQGVNYPQVNFTGYLITEDDFERWVRWNERMGFQTRRIHTVDEAVDFLPFARTI